MSIVLVVPLVVLTLVLALAGLYSLWRRMRERAGESSPVGALFATRYEASTRHKARLLGNLVR